MTSRPGTSSDLAAAMAYPIFAATDILRETIKSSKADYRALAIFCLCFPLVHLDGFATFNDTQLDLRDIPSDMLSLGQHTIDIMGPVEVCYIFTFVLIVFILVDLTPWAKRLVYFSCCYGCVYPHNILIDPRRLFHCVYSYLLMR
jgi:hypothetical protein